MKSEIRTGILLLVIALVVRFFATSIFIGPIQAHDGDGYFNVAKQLLETGEIKQGRYYARRAPMYPLVLIV